MSGTMMSERAGITTRLAYGALRSPRFNKALNTLGRAINKVGIHYETGKSRWKAAARLSNDPCKILGALNNLSACKSDSAKEAVEDAGNIKKALVLWKVKNPDEVIQTAWEYGYPQAKIISLLWNVMGVVTITRSPMNIDERLMHAFGTMPEESSISALDIRPEELLMCAVNALPAAMRKGYTADEIINFYRDIVELGPKAIIAFQALPEALELGEFNQEDFLRKADLVVCDDGLGVDNPNQLPLL